MDSDKQVVSIGLDITAQEFAWALEDEALASYQKGYEDGKKSREFWSRVRGSVRDIIVAGIVSFFLLMGLAWISR